MFNPNNRLPDRTPLAHVVNVKQPEEKELTQTQKWINALWTPCKIFVALFVIAILLGNNVVAGIFLLVSILIGLAAFVMITKAKREKNPPEN